jgi:Flp pilus assembly protein TadD
MLRVSGFVLYLLAALLCDAQTAPKFKTTVFAPTSAAATAGLSAGAKNAVEAGLGYFARGDLPAAETAFHKFLDLAPDNPTGLVNLGVVEYRLKRLDEAEKLLKRAVRVKPEAAAAWLALGVIYYEEDKLDAALAELSQAVLLEPKNAQAHNYLGVTVGRKGWNSGAEQELETAIGIDPDYAEAHFNLALFSLQRSPPAVELARRHYQKALDLGAARDPMIEKELDEGSAAPAR